MSSYQQEKCSSSGLTRSLAVVGAATLVLLGTRVLSHFFGPVLPYTLRNRHEAALNSDKFSTIR